MKQRYYILASGIGPMRALVFFSTYRGYRFTLNGHAARIYGSRAEAKRALRWAHKNGYESARVCEET